MSNQRTQSGFTDVDHTDAPANYIQLMDFQHGTAFVQMYKQHARRLLDVQPGQRILDAGCGTGEDARELARLAGPDGHVTGVDISQTMRDEAEQRSQGQSLPISFRQDDIHQLPFDDGAFDRCYADKTFQHLPDPKRALSELVRVTRPGGRLVIIDPDHDTHVLDTPYPDVTRRFFRFRSSGIRQPDIAHRQYAMFREAGLIDIVVEPLTWTATDYESIRPLSHFIEGMRLAEQHDVVTAEEASQWINALQYAINAGRFFHAVTYFITAGRKST